MEHVAPIFWDRWLMPVSPLENPFDWMGSNPIPLSWIFNRYSSGVESFKVMWTMVAWACLAMLFCISL